MPATDPIRLVSATRARTASLLALPLCLLLAPDRAAAQALCDPEYPCTYAIEDPGIQRAPGVLKFQARISQAKLPVGDGVFNDIEVKLIDALGTVRCSESFTGVRIRNSVLNLEVGHNMANCSLDDVVASTDGLSFQVCIGGGCLKPIPLGTVPYSFKANYAVQAQESYTADRAAQAHYAHRITADRDMMVSNTIGKGYFDFHTPIDGGTAYDATAFVPYADGAFIQWVPVMESNPTMNICAGDLATGDVRPLSELVLYAADTTMRGNAEVEANATVQGALTVNGGGAVNAGLTVNGGGTVNAGLTVNDGGTVNQGLTVTDTAVTGADLVCVGDAQVLGHSYLDGGGTVSAGLTVQDDGTNAVDLTSNGEARFLKQVSADGRVVGNAGIEVHNNIWSYDHTYASGGLTVADSVAAADLVCQGAAQFDTDVQFGNAIDDSVLTVYSTVNFRGTVNLDSPPSGAIGADSVDSAAIIDGSIGAADLGPNSVGGAAIIDGSVAAADLGSNSVGSAAIINGSVGAADLSNDAFDAIRAVVAEYLSPSLTSVTSGVSTNLNAVSSDGSQWVVVGDSGVIRTSLDAVNWVGRTSGTTARLIGLAYGNAGWVAVGATGTILTSADATTWSSRTSGTTVNLTGVAHDGTGLWVAVGYNGTILTSPDGVGWTSRASGTTLTIHDVHHDGAGLWVAVTGGRTVVTSANGTTWTARPLALPYSYAGAVTHDGRGLWIAGSIGAILTSPDGIGWTQAASTNMEVGGIACAPSGMCFAVMEAGGDPGEVMRTFNRTAWAATPTGSMEDLWGVAYNGRFVMVGTAGTILISGIL